MEYKIMKDKVVLNRHLNSYEPDAKGKKQK